MANRGSFRILARRFGALFVDIVLLAAVRLIAGRILSGEWCASLGAFAPLIGLAVAVLYTGALNSRMGGGQTAGKRLFGIQVVGANGLPVSFARSVGRSVLLWIAIAEPPMVRDLALQTGSAAVVMLSLFLAGVIGLGIVYLLLFNRRTGQGLHDLIAGTFVVEKGSATEVIAAPLGMEHRYVLAGLLVLVAAAMVLQTPSQRRRVADFQLLDRHVRQSDAFQQLRHFEESGKTLEIGVQLKRDPESLEDVQRRVAGIVLSAYPAAEQMEQMKVTVSHNCDLGVLGRVVKWGAVREMSRNATVADWRRVATR